jgi:peroxiredoxin
VELQRDYETISGLNAEILAVSVDDLPGARQAVQDLGLEFPVLSDQAAEVVSVYGVFNLHNNDLPTPATFIIDREGVIRWEYIGETAASDRPSNSLIIEQLRQLN